MCGLWVIGYVVGVVASGGEAALRERCVGVLYYVMVGANEKEKMVATQNIYIHIHTLNN